MIRAVALALAVVPVAHESSRAAAGATAQASQALQAPKPELETPHLTITTSSSSPATPGGRLSLYLDVVPKPKMHVYAPEQKDYIPIRLTLKADDETFRAQATKFPKPQEYFFAPLKETQLVFSKPFRIVQDVTLAATPALRERARAGGASITIAGTVRYQACDDAICYVPREVAVQWTAPLADK